MEYRLHPKVSDNTREGPVSRIPLFTVSDRGDLYTTIITPFSLTYKFRLNYRGQRVVYKPVRIPSV